MKKSLWTVTEKKDCKAAALLRGPYSPFLVSFIPGSNEPGSHAFMDIWRRCKLNALSFAA